MDREKLEFIRDAVVALTPGDRHNRYDFPRTASIGSGFPLGTLTSTLKGVTVIITSVGLNNLINRQFSATFNGEHAIKFKYTEDPEKDDITITFADDFQNRVVERVFGEQMTEAEILQLVILALVEQLNIKREELTVLARRGYNV